MVASFEFTYADDWRIALWYLDPYESWVAAGQNPLRYAFCEAGRHPWEVETARRTFAAVTLEAR